MGPVQLLDHFLSESSLVDKTLVLGLSMGADSTCLLHALKRSQYMGDLHVVYIDHGWRKESKDEAVFASKVTDELGFHFHLEEIADVDALNTPNLEEVYRNRRLEIFKRIYEKTGAAGLLLAHHLDDQAETVFKRIFEGAPITKLGGLKKEATLCNMNVYRPFLSLEKKQILHFLKENQLRFFHDMTNEDINYLRARMRKKIFPNVEKEFGKQSARNLSSFGEKMEKLSKYLRRRAKVYFDNLCEGPFGSFVDLTKIQDFELLELEEFIRMILEKYRAQISAKALENLLDIVSSQRSHKSVFAKEVEIRYEEGKLFFLRPLPRVGSLRISHIDSPQKVEIEGYNLQLEKGDPKDLATSWSDFFKGEVTFMIRDEDPYIKQCSYLDRLGTKTLKKKFLEEKVPTFLRQIGLGVFENDQLTSSLLLPNFKEKENGLCLKLRIKPKEKS